MKETPTMIWYCSKQTGHAGAHDYTAITPKGFMEKLCKQAGVKPPTLSKERHERALSPEPAALREDEEKERT
jgi:hypothetical protein